MKVIVVYVGEIRFCPPASSLVQVLCDLGHETVLCTMGTDEKQIKDDLGNSSHLRVKFAGKDYKGHINLIRKATRMFEIRRRMWEFIDSEYDDNTIIWVVSEGSLKHLGSKLLKYRYILHLLELHEGIYYISRSPILKLNYKNFARTARVVLEAEYNRAHITKAWWGLNELPMVFPNKPYNKIAIQRNASITNKQANELIEKLKGKNIILYQGNISKERPLEEYVKAVGELGSDYAFIMMLNGENPYPELHYDNFYCLPFIAPPYHLEVTSHAKIGILSYTPIKNDYSILNTLYCAPNKVWEYSQFGIPMIGNDLPALRELFIEYANGICLKRLEKEEIKLAIKKIIEDYPSYERASLKYFNSVDMKEITENILKQAET